MKSQSDPLSHFAVKHLFHLLNVLDADDSLRILEKKKLGKISHEHVKYVGELRYVCVHALH